MAFWKRPIELPPHVYQCAGDCLVYFYESQIKVRKIEASFMSANNACELLDLVKEGLAKLADLIANFPIKSDALVVQSDMSDDIQICEKRKHALLAMADVAPSDSLSSCRDRIDGYDALQFQQSVINMSAILWIRIEKAMS